jgi:hypothetical protein
MLARLWVQKNRRYYLGEWHYHPALQTHPSGHDIAQMVYISQAPNYQCQEPIMLVIGKQIEGIRSIRAFVFPRGNEFKEFFETQNLGNSN